MINFIICEDNDFFKEGIRTVISNFMMKNDIEYKIHSFSDYDTKFLDIISAKMSFKIYILDIETPTRSGIDIARIIREQDLNSIIIFLTSHEELGLTILKNDIFCLSFINKFDDYENKLIKSIKKALILINKKQVLRFEEKGVIYTIDTNDILYITRDRLDRKCIIKTDYIEYKCTKSLFEIKTLLDDRFVQTHRACFVNKDMVSSINKVNSTITFKNGLSINLFSYRYKKEFM